MLSDRNINIKLNESVLKVYGKSLNPFLDIIYEHFKYPNTYISIQQKWEYVELLKGLMDSGVIPERKSKGCQKWIDSVTKMIDELYDTWRKEHHLEDIEDLDGEEHKIDFIRENSEAYITISRAIDQIRRKSTEYDVKIKYAQIIYDTIQLDILTEKQKEMGRKWIVYYEDKLK